MVQAHGHRDHHRSIPELIKRDPAPKIYTDTRWQPANALGCVQYKENYSQSHGESNRLFRARKEGIDGRGRDDGDGGFPSRVTIGK